MSAFERLVNRDIRAVSRGLWGSPASGLAIPAWAQQSIYTSSGGAMSGTAVSGTTFAGFVGAAQASGNAAWALLYGGPIERLASTGASAQSFPAAPSGKTLFTGLGQLSNVPYFSDASGVVYTVSGGISGVSVGTFGQLAAQLVGASGNHVLSLLPATSGVGNLNVGTAASSVVTAPVNLAQCLAVSSGGTSYAVGGTVTAGLVSGFAAMSVNPADSTYMAGATPAAARVSLWHNIGNDNWAELQAVTGVGQVVGLSWSLNGTTLIGCDTASGSVRVISYAFGAITLSQSIPVAGAAAVAIALDSANALVCQPTLNTLTPLVFSGASWVSGSTIAVANPRSALALSETEIVVGCASGLAFMNLSAGLWSIGSTTAIGFVPFSLATDGLGNVFAAGPSGIFSAVYASGGTATFAGATSGLVWQQNQLVVGDNTAALLRVYSYFQGSVTQQSSISAVAVTALLLAGDTLFAAATASTKQFRFYSPYTLAYQPSGVVAVYDGAAWTSTALRVGSIPEALTFDPSGNVSVATLDNVFWTVAATGGVAASATIAQDTGQPQTTPIGISSLRWIGNALYGTSSLNEAVVRIV